MQTIRLALIGECMIELQETEPGLTTQTFGGDTLNTAIYCARLGRDLPLEVDYVTALGEDRFSDRMIAFWEQEGVGSRLVQRQRGELPGLYYIEVDEQGERFFYYWRSAAAARKCFEFPGSDRVLRELAAYDGIYLSGISLAILNPAGRETLLQRLEELARRGTAIYFDCNYRAHLWSSPQEARDACERLWRVSDIVFLTMSEAEVLLDCSREPLVHAELEQRGAGESVLKNGAEPCSIGSGGVISAVEAHKVDRVIDTTAAGDSFSGVYLVARCFGCPPEAAAAMAHATAAYVIRHKGAIAPLAQMPLTGRDILARKTRG